MTNLNRTLTILIHMQKYCNEIIETNENFHKNFKEFEKNHIYRNSISMAMLQIGELINHLSSDYLSKTNSIVNWKEIKGMRNRFAHDYFNMSLETIFNASLNDIPNLNEFLKKEINDFLQD